MEYTIEKISVVVPVYNSSKTIEEVLRRIEAVFDRMTEKFNFEIILVDDCSFDNTAEICRKISLQKRYIKFLKLSKNFGQICALMAGFSVVKGDYIISLDDDLQTPPEEMERLIKKLKENNYDIVFADYAEKSHTKFRNLGSHLSDRMAEWLMEKPKDIYVSSFFIAKRFIIDEIIKYDKPYPYLTGLFFRTTKNVGSVIVKHEKRKEGKSGYNIKKLLSLFLDGLTNYSVKPLRISSFLGGIISLVSFIFIIILVVVRLS
jgi:polyisoprenyl-phosphate glycosyltransferase